MLSYSQILQINSCLNILNTMAVFHCMFSNSCWCCMQIHFLFFLFLINIESDLNTIAKSLVNNQHTLQNHIILRNLQLSFVFRQTRERERERGVSRGDTDKTMAHSWGHSWAWHQNRSITSEITTPCSTLNQPLLRPCYHQKKQSK